MRRSTLAGIVVLIILIAAAAFAIIHKNSPATTPSTTNSNQTSSNNSSTNYSKNQPSTSTVNISNMMFTPSQITIAKGGTVTWTNNDSTAHTVVDDLSNAGGPNSGDIAPGQNYSFTFNKSGSFQYHCSIHPSMRGTIVVK